MYRLFTAAMLAAATPLAAQTPDSTRRDSAATHRHDMPGHDHDATHAAHHPAAKAATDDSAFAGVQRRGARIMGVDQTASTHRFETLPDGGRIVYVMNDPADAAGAATIRAHLRQIEADFARGDFSRPFGVHAQQVPGTAEMAARRAAISYVVKDVPGGAELRMATKDAAAARAIAEFLQFQRDDHRAH